VGFGKAIGRGRKLVVVFQRIGNAERVQVRMQMPTHAIRADHHDRMYAVRGRLADLFFRLAATIYGLLAQLALDMTFNCAPVSIERRDQLAIRGDRPVLLLPGGAGSSLLDAVGIVLELLEEGLPILADGGWIVLIGGMQFL